MQNGSSVGICTHGIQIFARLAPICNAQSSVLLSTFSASELSRKFIEGPLLVGLEAPKMNLKRLTLIFPSTEGVKK